MPDAPPASGPAAGDRAVARVRHRGPAARRSQPPPRAIASHGLNARKTSPKQRADKRHADPEEHVDQGRQQVVARVRGPRPGRRRRRGEERDADRAADAARASRGTRSRSRVRLVLPARPLPQRAERDERDDQHDRRGPREQPARDRQVLLADQPVGERRRGQRARPASAAARPATTSRARRTVRTAYAPASSDATPRRRGVDLTGSAAYRRLRGAQHGVEAARLAT